MKTQKNSNDCFPKRMFDTCLKAKWMRTAALMAVVWCSVTMEAKKVGGYIVTNENDTINGLIDVRVYSNVGDLLTRNIGLELCFAEVYFKKNSTERFVAYKPGEIKEYGFVLRKKHYLFKTFLIKSKSINYKDAKRNNFLQLIYKDDRKIIYRHQKYRVTEEVNRKVPYYEYYTIDENGGLLKVKF